MITIGSYTVQYNRQERTWEVTGGDTPQRFQTGSIGKREAIKFAICLAFPDVAAAVARLCQKNDHAAGRAWAAAELLIGGCVQEPGRHAESGEVARVMSTRNRCYYSLSRQEGKLSCTCPDYESCGVVIHGQGFCKHGLAYLLGLYLNWPLMPAREESSPPAARLRRAAGGRWRGRSVMMVNGPATRRGTGILPQPGTPSGMPAYANGEPVSALHQTAYASFVAITGRPPFNHEKLMSWYYGR